MLRRDIPGVCHLLENVVATPYAALKVGCFIGFVIVRRFQHGGKVGSLRNVQVLGAYSEVVLRSSLNTVNLIAQKNQVQVAGKNVFFAELLFKRN